MSYSCLKGISYHIVPGHSMLSVLSAHLYRQQLTTVSCYNVLCDVPPMVTNSFSGLPFVLMDPGTKGHP